MLERIAASCLVVLAFLPFTAPFSTFAVADLIGSPSFKRCSSDVLTSGVGTAAVPPDVVAGLAVLDVQPVGRSRHGASLTLPVVWSARGPGAAPQVRAALIVPNPDHPSGRSRPRTTLRL